MERHDRFDRTSRDRRTARQRWIAVIVLGSLGTGVAGCAELQMRYPQGLKWHLENEAHKKELERQGFPQYVPPV
jgi:hypothetical protein